MLSYIHPISASEILIFEVCKYLFKNLRHMKKKIHAFFSLWLIVNIYTNSYFYYYIIIKIVNKYFIHPLKISLNIIMSIYFWYFIHFFTIGNRKKILYFFVFLYFSLIINIIVDIKYNICINIYWNMMKI